MTKRFLAVFLCVLLVLALLPTTVLAEKAASVWISGVELTSDTPYYHNGANGAAGTANATAADYNAFYDAETGILSLKGLSVADSTAMLMLGTDSDPLIFTYAVYADGDLTIHLHENNVLSTAANAADRPFVNALFVNGNLTVTGDGALTVTAGNIIDNDAIHVRSAAVHAEKSMLLSGGTLTGNGGTILGVDTDSIGVYVGETLTVTGGTLTGNGGNATADGGEEGYYGYSEGILAKALVISGGSVTGKGGATVGYTSESSGINTTNITANGTGSISAIGGNAEEYSFGIICTENYDESTDTYSGGNLTVADTATVHAVGGSSDRNKSYGITADGRITVSGGTLISSGGTAGENSYGVVADNSIVLSGGTLTATGNSGMDSFGVFCRSNSEAPALSVNGGILTATGGEATDDSYGVYAKTSDVAVSGGELLAEGSTADDKSIGIYAESGSIRISDGKLTAKANAVAASNAALNVALVQEGIITAQGSTAVDGSSPVAYADADNGTYLWVCAYETVNPFTDVNKAHWFYKDALYVYKNKLMLGTSATTFSPGNTTTRGMIVTILYRVESEPAVTGACPFNDVRAGSYYEKAITWAAANNIVGGYGSGRFGPDDSITREQMAAILYRYAAFKQYPTTNTTDLTGFSDYNKISNYAIAPMSWANAEGLINGVGNNLLDPAGTAIRAQAAAILHRFIEKF